MEQLEKTNILSLNDLCARLGMPRIALEQTAAIAGSLYSPFESTPKPRWFPKKVKAHKRRTIDNPVEPLKRIQKRIETKLLKPITFPDYQFGGVSGRDVLDNVELHCGSRVLVTMDIRSFFPSITTKMVYKVWNQELGCSPPVSRLLTQLTTYKRHLPQGAPTSSLLANLVLFSIDGPIREICRVKNVRYSTWIDDLAFSGENSREIIQTAVEALKSAGLRVSHRKLHVMSTAGRMMINGIIINRFPSVLRARVSQIRSGIHKLEMGEVPLYQLERYLRSVKGSVAQIARISPRRGLRLQSQLSEAIDSVARTKALSAHV